MQCPQCQNQMKQHEIETIPFFECRSCRGMWFDYSELDAVTNEVMPDLQWMDVDEWIEEASISKIHEKVRCPRCLDTDLSMVTSPSTHTEIGTCTKCRGSWLPEGQFLNLINTLLDEANRKTVPEYIRLLLQETKEMLISPDSNPAEWQNLKTIFSLLKHRLFIENPKLQKVVEGLNKALPL